MTGTSQLNIDVAIVETTQFMNYSEYEIKMQLWGAVIE